MLLAAVLSGCGLGAVEVSPHTPLPGTAQVCDELISRLPDVVSDGVRRDVDPPSPAVAAWGRPPIILRCGVPEPTDVDPTLAVLNVSGVDWRSVPGEGGTFFSTDGRVAVVEVAIPDDYAPEADVLIDLAPAISAVPGADAAPS